MLAFGVRRLVVVAGHGVGNDIETAGLVVECEVVRLKRERSQRVTLGLSHFAINNKFRWSV